MEHQVVDKEAGGSVLLHIVLSENSQVLDFKVEKSSSERRGLESSEVDGSKAVVLSVSLEVIEADVDGSHIGSIVVGRGKNNEAIQSAEVEVGQLHLVSVEITFFL